MERELKFGLSMQEASPVDPSTFYTAFWLVEKYAQIAKRAGLDGLEFFPTRLTNYQVRKNSLSNFAKEKILSGHQSYRGEKGLRDILKSTGLKRRIIVSAAFFALPHQDVSLATLRELQKQLGRDITVVNYPYTRTGPAKLFSEELPSPNLILPKNRIFQPSAEHIKIWDLIHPETIQQYLNRFGWSGLCLDLFHVRERNKELQTPHWKEYLPVLLPFTKEIHVAAGRIDSPQTEIDTVAELADLYSGTRETEISEMLEFIGKSGWKGLVISEIPAFSLRGIAGIKSPFVTPEKLVNLHKRLTENIKGLLATQT